MISLFTYPSYGFMFDNLSKAQEIYETDPEGAHSLINKGIDYETVRLYMARILL